MTNKERAAGWVIEVTRPTKRLGEPTKPVYFDVAIANAVEAANAASRKSGIIGSVSRPVRLLSSDEVEFAHLKVGDVRPS